LLSVACSRPTRPRTKCWPLIRYSADILMFCDSSCSVMLRSAPSCPALLRRRADAPSEGLKIWSSQGPVPVGWFLGRPSKLSSYLVCEEYKKAGLPPIKWWSDLYCDDVPHWRKRPGGTRDEGMLVSGPHAEHHIP
jgi:hypothetical protein